MSILKSFKNCDLYSCIYSSSTVTGLCVEIYYIYIQYSGGQTRQTLSELEKVTV